jgi:hypothetical protein
MSKALEMEKMLAGIDGAFLPRPRELHEHVLPDATRGLPTAPDLVTLREHVTQALGDLAVTQKRLENLLVFLKE